MTEKAKRKTNPRRRLLIRLIAGIGILVTLISAGVYALRPTGAQIVFIAPDDNGVDNIWIADLNTPENPRQLTFHDNQDGKYLIRDFQSARNSSIITYLRDVENDINSRTLWLFDIETREHRQILTCSSMLHCGSFQLHPTGMWLAYAEKVYNEGELSSYQIYVINLLTNDVTPVYSVANTLILESIRFLYLEWLGDQDQLVFQSVNESITNTFLVFDMSENQIIRSLDLGNHHESLGYPRFSDDSTKYAFQISLGTITDAGSADYKITAFTIENDYEPYRLHYLQDWHPNSIYLLMSPVGDGMRAVYEYDTVNKTTNILMQNRDYLSYSNVTFNYDGSNILFNLLSYSGSLQIIGVYNMETREEIALPLFGRNPQWVNGGR